MSTDRDFEDLQRELGVLDRGDGEGGDHEHALGQLDDLEVELREVAGAVNDHEIEGLAQLGDDGAHVLGRDQVGELRADRGEQRPHPGGTKGQHLAHALVVDAARPVDKLGDAAAVVEVEHDPDVAELEVEIDERDAPPGLFRERHG